MAAAVVLLELSLQLIQASLVPPGSRHREVLRLRQCGLGTPRVGNPVPVLDELGHSATLDAKDAFAVRDEA